MIKNTHCVHCQTELEYSVYESGNLSFARVCMKPQCPNYGLLQAPELDEECSMESTNNQNYSQFIEETLKEFDKKYKVNGTADDIKRHILHVLASQIRFIEGQMPEEVSKKEYVGTQYFEARALAFNNALHKVSSLLSTLKSYHEQK